MRDIDVARAEIVMARRRVSATARVFSRYPNDDRAYAAWCSAHRDYERAVLAHRHLVELDRRAHLAHTVARARQAAHTRARPLVDAWTGLSLLALLITGAAGHLPLAIACAVSACAALVVGEHVSPSADARRRSAAHAGAVERAERDAHAA